MAQASVKRTITPPEGTLATMGAGLGQHLRAQPQQGALPHTGGALGGSSYQNLESVAAGEKVAPAVACCRGT